MEVLFVSLGAGIVPELEQYGHVVGYADGLSVHIARSPVGRRLGDYSYDFVVKGFVRAGEDGDVRQGAVSVYYELYRDHSGDSSFSGFLRVNQIAVNPLGKLVDIAAVELGFDICVDKTDNFLLVCSR